MVSIGDIRKARKGLNEMLDSFIEIATAKMESEDGVVKDVIYASDRAVVTMTSADKGLKTEVESTPCNSRIVVVEGEASIKIGGKTHLLNKTKSELKISKGSKFVGKSLEDNTAMITIMDI